MFNNLAFNVIGRPSTAMNTTAQSYSLQSDGKEDGNYKILTNLILTILKAYTQSISTDSFQEEWETTDPFTSVFNDSVDFELGNNVSTFSIYKTETQTQKNY